MSKADGSAQAVLDRSLDLSGGMRFVWMEPFIRRQWALARINAFRSVAKVVPCGRAKSCELMKRFDNVVRNNTNCWVHTGEPRCGVIDHKCWHTYVHRIAPASVMDG